MPVQVYADDSGGKGQGRVFIIAGLMAYAENWARFSDEWQACLNQQPRLRYFKMREAAACHGEFHGFSEMQRDDRLRQFAQIINRYADICTYTALDLEAFKDIMGKGKRKPFSEPYFWPFQNFIIGSCVELWECNIRERFEVIFDEHVIFAPRVKLWYPVLKAMWELREPEDSQIMPTEPMFRRDDEFLPIQAADLFAWCFRKGTEVGGGAERPFEWLLKEMPNVSLSDHRQYYDKERQESVMALVEKEFRQLMTEGNPAMEKAMEPFRDLFER